MNQKNIKEPIFEYLESLSEFIPASFYWCDLDGRFINLNNRTVKAIGAQKKEDIIGKNVYELYQDQFIADKLQKDIDQIVRTGKPSLVEDKILDVTTHKFRYFSATRGPLFNKKVELIGVMGVSIETTAEKEAELLRAENEVHKLEKEAAETIAKEQQNFRKIADRVAHDLRPLVATISYLAKLQAINLPEKERITLRDAANRINDLANYLLSYYKPTTFDENTPNQPVPLLVTGAITEILSEKRLQYPNLPVRFINKFHPDSYFTFIIIQAVAFKSMLSNLINNSVDAFEGNEGIVTVGLECETDVFKITIQDNGKGMSPALVDKIMNRVAVTSGKQDGHGIGLTQVRETLEQNNGKFTIDSKPGVGTKITLTFPKITPPAWVAEKVELNDDDLIIVVDDDSSIHGSWDLRFAAAAPQFRLKHFTLADDAIRFMNAMSAEEKQKIFLLTDYELLEQGLNGLDIIKQTGVQRSILVTSCYEDTQVQEQAQTTDTTILPKLLALEVPISVTSSNNDPKLQTIPAGDLLHVELLIVDDYKPLTESLSNSI